MRKADVLFAAGRKEEAGRALMQARDALGVGPTGVGSAISAADQKMILDRIVNNEKALTGGQTLLPQPPKPFGVYQGPLIPPCEHFIISRRGGRTVRRERCMIVHYPKPHAGDAADWAWTLNYLNEHREDLRRLVDWFNNGPVAQRTPDAKRDWTEETLLAFLSDEKMVRPQAGPLRKGTTQWCDRIHLPGGGFRKEWHSSPVQEAGAAWYTTTGDMILNVKCANPLGVIRMVTTPVQWLPCEEMAATRAFPPYPVINYGMPQAEFSFHVEGIFQPYALPLPPVVPVPIIPPAITVLSVPEVMPKLAIPGGC
jgi:hypothetical protein